MLNDRFWRQIFLYPFAAASLEVSSCFVGFGVSVDVGALSERVARSYEHNRWLRVGN